MTSNEEIAPAVKYAGQAYDAIRSFNHAKLGSAQLPAPVVYDVLGDLKAMGDALPQAFTQLASGLGRSLNQYDVTEDDGTDPVQNVATAADHLTRAAQLADQIGDELAQAQAALRGQGYREKSPEA